MGCYCLLCGTFVLLLLLPAVITWYLCNRYQKKQFAIAASVYGVALMLFFISPAISHTIDFPAYILNKQNEFKALGGNSQLLLPVLAPNLAGFVKFFPYAFDIAFLRPHPTEITNFFILACNCRKPLYLCIDVVFSI